MQIIFIVAGDKIYGRIRVDPVQNLGSSFDLHVEKVFLCSGKDGYIPKYDPENNEFGCVAESPNLQYTFKILVSFSLIICCMCKQRCFSKSVTITH